MMLDYSVDLEILSDLYYEYLKYSEESPETIHRLGRDYIPFIREYGLDDRAASLIRKLAAFENEEQLDQVVSGLAGANHDRTIIIQDELRSYNEFCMSFSGNTRLALMKIPEYVFGRRIPFKVREKSLHINVASHASMTMALDFDDVLIEDGRNPREVIISRIWAEKIVQQRRVSFEDGRELIMDMPAYRFSFINKLDRSSYPVRVHSFTCTDLTGRISLYDYAGYPGRLPVTADKIAFRRINYLLDSYLFKVKCLGVGSLNENEINIYSLVKVFHELTSFYLDEESIAGETLSKISFNEKKARSLVLDDADVLSVCELLRPYGFKKLLEALGRLNEDRAEFGRFWIRYASTRQSAHLYGFLLEILYAGASSYKRRPLPLSYRKFHAPLKRLFDEEFSRRGWEGAFPCYYRENNSINAGGNNVYSKKYTHVNTKRKSYYVDIMESISGTSYTIMALYGDILLRDEEDGGDFCALDGCFKDGARRKAKMIGSLSMSGKDDDGEILDAAALLADRITRAVRGEA